MNNITCRLQENLKDMENSALRALYSDLLYNENMAAETCRPGLPGFYLILAEMARVEMERRKMAINEIEKALKT